MNYRVRASNIKKHLVGEFSFEINDVHIDVLADRIRDLIGFLKADGEQEFRIYAEPCAELTGK